MSKKCVSGTIVADVLLKIKMEYNFSFEISYAFQKDFWYCC